jgi:tetratricopeptide (TPR) repeat protein
VTDDWTAHAEREEARYRDGLDRIPDDSDGRQRQLTRMGNAAYGAGLSYLMLGDRTRAVEWLTRAARTYRESYDDAPPGSWGRLIAMMKASILTDDWKAAEEYARDTLDEGAADAESPIGRYAACLALLTLGRDEDARVHADAIRTRDDFPSAVGDALAMLAAGTDQIGYVDAVEAVLESFEQRDEYLEDVAVADTVIVLQTLAVRRDLAADLSSPLLPGGG